MIKFFNKILLRDRLKNYLDIESNILYLVKAQFFLQLIATSFFLILNIYLSKSNFSDSEIADYISYRFLAVIFLSFPFGFLISYRRLKPFFVFSSIILPIVAVLLIIMIHFDIREYLRIIFFVWGICFTIFQISVLPFIMRYSSKKTQTFAISLSFATHSIAMVFSGLLIFLLDVFFHMQEGGVLILISLLGFGSFYYILKINEDRLETPNFYHKRKYDWILILQCIFPTLIIAVGAGLTIPFINLFFYHYFNLGSSDFALLGGASSLLVAISALTVPFIKNKFGFERSIIVTQLLAVFALVLLATTAYFNDFTFIIYFAILFYVVRAPLMNMAAPLTSELTMMYVGKNNQEMLSAIVSAIWSGSWFFSSQIFKKLMNLGYSYSNIFYITSALYLVGILLYYFLIKSYRLKHRM